VNRWRQSLAIYLLMLFVLVLLTSKPVDAAGLSYRELLHFYVQDGKAQVNQAQPDVSDPGGLRETPVSLDFSADGKILAIGYKDRVRFWNLPTGTLQSEFRLKQRTDPYGYSV
jgi:hypothetical protein